ncbi:MAG TPA: RHS repeat-associated core domain-containing protein [Thermoanaerobaculia bacterium]|nr:RHS repeat-associated core domain-containing protein [Thermoanaerobaculia bacterium]
MLKFTGHERDYAGLGDTNDLDYMHARYYAPTMGRFLSVDPVFAPEWRQSPQLGNRYAYVGNRPTIYTDPYGLLPRPLEWLKARIQWVRKQMVDPQADCAECILYGVTPDVTVTGRDPNPSARPAPSLSFRIADAAGGTDIMAGIMTGKPRHIVNGVRKQTEIAVALVAMGGGAKPLTTEVSRWGRAGLQEGDWVMQGRSSFWNYLKSGKWDPGPWNEFASPASGETYQVAASALKSPMGFGVDGFVKALLGQRLYLPLY